jgi:predicted Zn-dependent peptidase
MKSPLLDMPAPLAHVSQLKTPSTRITTLRNGVRVATEETYGQATAMGVFIDAGSRNETFETNGTTHVLQRMGFKVCKSLAADVRKPLIADLARAM